MRRKPAPHESPAPHLCKKQRRKGGPARRGVGHSSCYFMRCKKKNTVRKAPSRLEKRLTKAMIWERVKKGWRCLCVSASSKEKGATSGGTPLSLADGEAWFICGTEVFRNSIWP